MRSQPVHQRALRVAPQDGEVATAAGLSTPEFRLLVACSWQPPEADQTRTAGLIRQLCNEAPLNWDAFLGLVRRHQVSGLVQKALQKAGTGNVPPAFAQSLNDLSGAEALRALRVAVESGRLCRAFAAEGLAMVPLKGVVLSWQLFGDPTVRQAGDVDLMIRPETLEAADSLLTQMGYRCQVPRASLARLRSHGYECSYWNEFTRLSVDLHWRHELWTATQTGDLWEHCHSKVWSGTSIQCLQGDALLLFLCDHGAKHRWSRLKWLSDVATLLAKPRLAPWSELLALAKRWDLEEPLAEAGWLLRCLYGIELPTELMGGDIASAKHASESIAAMLMTREELVLAETQSGPWRNLRFLRRRRRALPWRTHLWNLLIQADDLQQYPLPAAMVWLYYPLRPLLWFWRRYGRTSPAPAL